MPAIGEQEVAELFAGRRFVVLEGPPGTGKTRMAVKLIASFTKVAERRSSFTRTQHTKVSSVDSRRQRWMAMSVFDSGRQWVR